MDNDFFNINNNTNNNIETNIFPQNGGEPFVLSTALIQLPQQLEILGKMRGVECPFYLVSDNLHEIIRERKISPNAALLYFVLKWFKKYKKNVRLTRKLLCEYAVQSERKLDKSLKELKKKKMLIPMEDVNKISIDFKYDTDFERQKK